MVLYVYRHTEQYFWKQALLVLTVHGVVLCCVRRCVRCEGAAEDGGWLDGDESLVSLGTASSELFIVFSDEVLSVDPSIIQ